jgi:glycosyltransferase involved in cell wall biosynthesis
VLLVTPQPFFEDRGTPIAVACTARALAERGRRVDVLAFPLGRPLAMPGVQVLRAGNPCGIRKVPIGFSPQKLLLDASLLSSFRSLLSERRYDIVHAVEEAAWIAAVLCPPRRVPFIYDMASAIPAELESHPLLGLRPVQALLRATERRVVSLATQVICSEGLGRRVRAMGTGTPVTQWRFPAFEVVESADSVAGLRTQLRLGARDRVVLYAGNFSRYQGVDLLMDAFARVAGADSRLRLVCVGAEDEAQADAFHRRSPPELRDRVRIVPRVTRSEMPRWLAMADCLASPRSGGANLPLKVFEYLAAGKPIVATRNAAHDTVLGQGRAILCDDDPAALGEGIATVFADPPAARRMAQGAQAYAREKHGWQDFSRFVNEVYDSALDRGAAAAAAVGAPLSHIR